VGKGAKDQHFFCTLLNRLCSRLPLFIYSIKIVFCDFNSQLSLESLSLESLSLESHKALTSLATILEPPSWRNQTQHFRIYLWLQPLQVFTSIYDCWFAGLLPLPIPPFFCLQPPPFLCCWTAVSGNGQLAVNKQPELEEKMKLEEGKAILDCAGIGRWNGGRRTAEAEGDGGGRRLSKQRHNQQNEKANEKANPGHTQRRSSATNPMDGIWLAVLKVNGVGGLRIKRRWPHRCALGMGLPGGWLRLEENWAEKKWRNQMRICWRYADVSWDLPRRSNSQQRLAAADPKKNERRSWKRNAGTECAAIGRMGYEICPGGFCWQPTKP
jgi:hypothetical protein